jgi:hypothetical protein
MKIQQNDFEYLQSKIFAKVEELGLEKVLDHYIKLTTWEIPAVKEPEKRFRWDLFHVAGLNNYACDTLYTYLNDDHIDTALRKIAENVKENIL